MKSVKQIEFDEIFYFAEKKYGIGWNPCNDIFFGNALDYGSVSDFCDWGAYIDPKVFGDDKNKKASSFTKEEVLDMSDHDQSYVITAAYLESIGLEDDEIQVDCR